MRMKRSQGVKHERRSTRHSIDYFFLGYREDYRRLEQRWRILLCVEINVWILERKFHWKTFFTFSISTNVFLSFTKLCRCGRRKTGSHLTKCMQKCVIKYSEGEQVEEQPARSPNIPRTSNALNGFYQCKYAHLEKDTRYVTPKIHLKHKITDQIYDNIIIGWGQSFSFLNQTSLYSKSKLIENKNSLKFA